MSSVRFRLSLAAAVISVAAGLISGFAAIGSPLKRPVAITLFFSGFAAGASLVSLLVRRRRTAAESPVPAAAAREGKDV